MHDDLQRHLQHHLHCRHHHHHDHRHHVIAVVDSYYHTRSNEQTGRTCQLVLVERKGRHIDELAEFRGDRPCQRK